MSDQHKLNSLAEKLWNSDRDKIPIKPLTLKYPDLTVEEAYEIQKLNIAKRLNLGQKIIGRKIGLTSKPMQELLGVYEPDYGCLLDSMVYPDRGKLPSELLLQPKVEAEIAFVLKEALSGPNVTIQDVLQATDYVLPALEIVDSRVADWKITLPDTVADNASSGLFILGERALKPTDLDLRLIGVVLMLNDELVNTGAGAAALGHPALCVAWLANKLHQFGEELHEGEVVLSGALSAAVEIRKGDRFEAIFDRLGSVQGIVI